MPDCQHYRCNEEATTVIRIMPYVPDLDDLIFPYCETHSREILSNSFVFPGAREEENHDLLGS